MYNKNIIEQLVDFISSKDGKTDKSRLQNEVQDAFDLVKERSVEDFDSGIDYDASQDMITDFLRG